MQPLKTIGDRIRTRRCLLIKPFTHCTSDMETVKEMKTACSWPPPCRACEVYSCSLESGAPLHPPTLRPSQAFLLLTGLVAACFLPVLAHAPFRSRGGGCGCCLGTPAFALTGCEALPGGAASGRASGRVGDTTAPWGSPTQAGQSTGLRAAPAAGAGEAPGAPRTAQPTVGKLAQEQMLPALPGLLLLLLEARSERISD